MEIVANEVLDAQELACPMPIVKTKKAIAHLSPGEVMEVRATDKGSTSDLKAWAESTGHQYLGTIAEGEVLKHYLRKASVNEMKEVVKYEKVISLEELQSKMTEETPYMILDVREPAEFTFGHIPGAVNIPLGNMEEKMDNLDQNQEIYVICRTGSRSDLAAQQLVSKGFKHVTNVIPGMTSWSGPIEQAINHA